MTDERDPVGKISSDALGSRPAQQRHGLFTGCLFGCLGLFLFYVLSIVVLIHLGGWGWWHFAGLTIVFFTVRALTHRTLKAAVITTALGIIAVILNVFCNIEKPLSFDHSTPQKNDMKVMRELFRTSELPPSFKIAKVRWNGTDWFPSQGLRSSQYAVDVEARDLKSLLANVSDRMKPSEPQSYNFFFVMDEKVRDSLIWSEAKLHWKQFELEIKEKLETIRWYSAVAWDEKTSPSLRLYIRVIPEYR